MNSAVLETNVDYVKINGGTTRWYNQKNQLHREDGPAVVLSSGHKEWYQNGELHRVDGPAVEFANGEKQWYQNGKYHRTDGPAIEYANGCKVWYINHSFYTEKEFMKYQRLQKAKKILGLVTDKLADWLFFVFYPLADSPIDFRKISHPHNLEV